MVWFPDNIPRRDRALQLQNDITLLQQSAVEAKAAMTTMDSRMMPYINKILAAHNMSTFDELQQKLNESLTDEQKQQYKDLCDNSAKLTQGTDTALMAMSGILFTSGILAKTIDIGNFLRAVNIATVFRSYAKAFITMVTEGVEAGTKAFRAVSAAFKVAGESLVEGSRLARYAANVGRFLKVLAIVGIFADAFILAFDYFEQEKQMNSLIGAIKELYTARIIAKLYASMCDTIKTQDGLMLGYLVQVGPDGTIPDALKPATDNIIKAFVDYIRKDWSGITVSSRLDLLIVMDRKRKSYVTNDPDYQDAIDDANNQMKPKDKPALAVLSSANDIGPVFAHAEANFDPPPVYEVAANFVHLDDLTKEHINEHFVPTL